MTTMRYGMIVFWMLAILLTARPVSGADFKVYRVIRSEVAPKIDGCLDEPCWAKAETIGGFLQYGSMEPAVTPTRARILHDDNNLYLGIECAEPDIKELQMKATFHDGSVWNDDEIEIFIDGNYDKKTYCQFAVNPLGTQYEGSKKEEYGICEYDLCWDGPWQAQAKIGKTNWVVEVAIPFSTLGVKPGPGNFWGANICRARRAGGASELTYWTNTGKNFHNVALFGHLIFEDYSGFIRKNQLTALWEKNRKELSDLLQSHPGLDETYRKTFSELCAPLVPITEKVSRGETITPDEFAVFFGKVEEAIRNAEELKSKILISLLFSEK